MKKIVSPNAMALLDKNTIAQGISAADLMKQAGEACAEIIISRTNMLDRVVIICGSGNNGGDGFVIARLLSERGNPLKIVCIGDMTKCSPESRRYFDTLSESENEIEIVLINDLSEIDELRKALKWGRVFIDCLFGNGLKNRPMPELYLRTIHLINEADKEVIAIDIPSGLSGETGQIIGEAVKARTTIAIQFIKQGCLLEDGPDLCGEIETVDIGIADDEKISSPHYLTEYGDFIWPQPRKANSHKYQYGSVLSVAGSKGMFGAGILCASASLKAGCGLVTALVPENAYDVFAMKMPNEIMVRSYCDLNENELSKIKYNTVLFGPGVGREADYDQFLDDILKMDIPVIIDADGLYHLKKKSGNLKDHEAPLILTPHIGEFCSFNDISVEMLKSDIINIGKKFAADFHLTLVLKGHRTLIFSEKGEVYVNCTGNPGMATAGSGDVLAGIIAGITAQGYDSVEAARCGVYYHGAAGDMYAGRFNETTLTASDLIEYLKVVLNH